MPIRQTQGKPFDSAQGKQKITPFLWFDTEAEEAMNYYVSIFKNSKVIHVTRFQCPAAQLAG